MKHITILLLAYIFLSNIVSAQTTVKHDELGRLTEIQYKNGETLTYAYDAVGNRQTHHLIGVHRPDLRITEIMYQPASNDTLWEWIEVYNADTFSVELSGYYLDNNNGDTLQVCNIQSGSIPSEKTAILFNADKISTADFDSVWGGGANLIPVTNWSMLDNAEDSIGLWMSKYDYGLRDFGKALEMVTYKNTTPFPVNDTASSIYLVDTDSNRLEPSNWVLSRECQSSPTFAAYKSQAKQGNLGLDIGSPADNVSWLIPSISINANNSLETCQNDSITFQASVTNGGDNPEVIWYKNDLPIDTASILTIEVFSTDSTIYAKLNSDHPCAQPSSTFSDTLNLNIHQIYSIAQSDTICGNEMYTLPSGNSVNTTNLYIDTLSTIYGCDSIITTTLKVHPTFAINVYDTICDSESYLLPDGSFTNIQNTYVNTLSTINACDSVITTYLTVNPTFAESVLASICDSENYTLPSGEIVNTANTYINTLISSNGCDSTITTTLTVHPTFAINVYDTICDSESYLLPDGNFTNVPDTYINTLPTVNACDSVITTYLTVNPTFAESVLASICDSENYSLPTGEIVNTANTYINTLT
ncbi:MAG: hypothetical protein GQ564_16410, partial [Bacteroidales bacterium]|nr:hypothetical protein [Bacteroidales bacterium]